MQVILLERIAKLGQMGDTVRVRDGYARNFLLPQGKALRANKGNLERFEGQRAQLEARNLERRQEAEAVAGKMDGESLVMIRSAGETGQLYGSVSTRDVADGLTESGFSIGRGQVELRNPIKTIGVHSVLIQLHPEVEVAVSVNVARSEDEANRQAAGEDLTAPEQDIFEFEEDDEEEGEGDEASDEEAAADGDSAETSEEPSEEKV